LENYWLLQERQPEIGSALSCQFSCFHWYIQEGQHPLTGQRAANFRLLANQ